MGSLRAQRLMAALTGVLVMAGLVVPAAQGEPADEPAAFAAAATPMPAVPDGLTVVGMGLDGAWAYAGLRGTETGAPRTLHRTPSDGSGSWEPVIDPATAEPLQFGPQMPTIDSGVILAQVGPVCQQRLITGPDTYRTIDNCNLVLSQGADTIVVLGVQYYPQDWSIQTLDGTVLDSGSGWSDEIPHVAGGVKTLMVDGVVTRRQVGSTTNLTTQSLPRSCNASWVTGARGQDIIAECSSTPTLTALLRSDASLPPYPLQGARWQLGSGFAVRQPGGTPGTAVQLSVADPGTGHQILQIPGVAGVLPVVDRADTSSFMMRTAPTALQVVELTGLAPPATTSEDTAAPVIESFLHPGPVMKPSGSGGVSFAWTADDPGHPRAVDFQVRSRTSPHGTAPPAWSELSLLFPRYDATVEASSDEDVCLEVRGIDWAGNVGPWKGTCTHADGSVPKVEWSIARGSLELLSGPVPQPSRVSWVGSDNDQVASYDLDYRLARSGQPMADWVSPPDWDALTTSSATRAFPAGSRVCFRITATDRVGHSATPHASGRPACSLVPLDDRSFTLTGSARRVSWGTAYLKTATALRTARDGVVKRDMRVKHVYLRMIGSFEGACPIVMVGSVRARCEGAEAAPAVPDTRGTRFSYTFPRQLQGTLRIRVSDTHRTTQKLDAVWVGHY